MQISRRVPQTCHGSYIREINGKRFQFNYVLDGRGLLVNVYHVSVSKNGYVGRKKKIHSLVFDQPKVTQ